MDKLSIPAGDYTSHALVMLLALRTRNECRRQTSKTVSRGRNDSRDFNSCAPNGRKPFVKWRV